MASPEPYAEDIEMGSLNENREEEGEEVIDEPAGNANGGINGGIDGQQQNNAREEGRRAREFPRRQVQMMAIGSKTNCDANIFQGYQLARVFFIRAVGL
jgi:hypothetical protein